MGRGWESSGRHDGITKTDWIMTMIIIVGRRVPARDLLVILVVPVDRSSSRVRRLIPHGSFLVLVLLVLPFLHHAQECEVVCQAGRGEGLRPWALGVELVRVAPWPSIRNNSWKQPIFSRIVFLWRSRRGSRLNYHRFRTRYKLQNARNAQTVLQLMDISKIY